MILSDTACATEAVPWDPPELSRFPGGVAHGAASDGRTSEAGAVYTEKHWLQKIEEARSAGFDEGFAQGQQAVAENTQKERDQLLQLMAQLQEPIQKINDVIMRELVEFGLTLAKLIVRREISSDGEYFLRQIERIFSATSVDTAGATVRMHPKDVALLEAILAAEKPEKFPELVADNSCPRGSCLVETGNSFIDAGIDTLIERIRDHPVPVTGTLAE